MKRTISDTLNLQKRAYISTETMLGTLYKDINDIPEKIKNSLPLLDYITIDYDSIEDKLSSLMDDYTREKEKIALKVEKKEKEYLKKIIGKFIKNKEFVVKEFIFDEEGSVGLDDQSHYYYNSRYNIEEEFNTDYHCTFSLTIIILNNNSCDNDNDYDYNEDVNNLHQLNLKVVIHQNIKIGSNKIITNTKTTVDFSENFSYAGALLNGEEKKGLMEENDAKELMCEINKKFIVDEFILKEIKEKINNELILKK